MSSGPVVVVTGSTRGIGLGLARELLARDARVVVSGRSAGRVAAAAAELGVPDRVEGVVCDVTDHASVQSLWDAAVRRFGQVDIWINNAGSTAIPVPLWEVPADELRRTVETNVLGTIYGTQVAVAGMRSQPGRGRVFNVEGMGSKGEVQAGLLPYGTTKAAIGYFDRALLKDLDGTGVAICSVRPGINVTDHLLYGAEHLSPERWAKTRKIFNILGDTPETTTPFLAERILATHKTGSRIAWLTTRKIAWRFATAGFRKRELIADVDAP